MRVVTVRGRCSHVAGFEAPPPSGSSQDDFATVAISSAISTIVITPVLSALRSARAGLAASTSSLVVRCQIGRITLAPLARCLATSPSSSA